MPAAASCRARRRPRDEGTSPLESHMARRRRRVTELALKIVRPLGVRHGKRFTRARVCSPVVQCHKVSGLHS